MVAVTEQTLAVGRVTASKTAGLTISGFCLIDGMVKRNTTVFANGVRTKERQSFSPDGRVASLHCPTKQGVMRSTCARSPGPGAETGHVSDGRRHTTPRWSTERATSFSTGAMVRQGRNDGWSSRPGVRSRTMRLGEPQPALRVGRQLATHLGTTYDVNADGRALCDDRRKRKFPAAHVGWSSWRTGRRAEAPRSPRTEPCPSPHAPSSANTKSSSPLVRVGWERFIEPATPSWDGTSPSKSLPEEFARDKERLDRFEREARLLAQLNHANIATLHGLEEHDGQQLGPRGTNELVMELVEGETLAERIAKGPLPVDEAIPLFIQIAEGLEAAHEKGIIHRDLKPANIKIGPDGKPKILDFGLAKAFVGDEPAADSSQSPTLTKGTALGAIMGTASYMSPEQARAKPIDKRTDLWAFGCCLYETLAGKRAFDGESVTDILAAVVRAEPDWQPLQGAPAGLMRLVRRCLSKDASLRLRDAGDARLELLDATREVLPTSSASTHDAWSWRVMLMVAAAAASLASIVTLALVRDGVDNVPRHVSRFTVALPAGERIPRAQRGSLALSRNGRLLVYVARSKGVSRLYSRDMSSVEARAVEGTERARGPFLDPDGEWIGFWADQKLKKVALRGGAPLTLCDLESFWGASWSDRDEIVFSNGSSLFRVPASGGTPEVVASPGEEEPAMRFPHVLPGGNTLLFAEYSVGRDPALGALSLDSGVRQTLISPGTDPRYLSSGHLVYGSSVVSAGRLMAVGFDAASLSVTGDPVPIVDGLNVAVDGTTSYDVSHDGTLAYKILQSERAEKLVWVDRRGRTEPVSDVAGFNNHPRISPDGRRIAGTRATNTFILDLARGSWTQRTFESGNRALWAPDGRTLYLASRRAGGQWQLFSAAADGSGDFAQLTEGAYRSPSSLSSDGRFIVFRQWGAGWDVGMLRLDGESKPELLLAGPQDEHTG